MKKSETCIHNLFEEQAEYSPNKISLVYRDQQLTFRELNNRANQLAHYLKKLEVRSETLVGLFLDRSIESIIGILGIIKAGCAYVPLDISYPIERLDFIIKDAQLPFILTKKDLLQKIPEYDGTIICIDENNRLTSIQPTDNPCNSNCTTENLIYVIYTSGSTGKPKGVMITHENLFSFVDTVQSVLPVKKEDIYLHTASFSYALSVRQLFVPLTQGASLVIAPQEHFQEPILFFKLMKEREITLTDLVPSQWRTCNLALSALDDIIRTDLLKNKLRRIISVGEPLPPDIPRKWAMEFKQRTQIVNIYGFTEATGMVTFYKIPPGDPYGDKKIPIGREHTNTGIHILDPKMTPVKDGTIGELYIVSKSLARGYINLPELTDQKFPTYSNERFYRTGDMVRKLPCGNIEYAGRSDLQIKTRGIRVALEEIEMVLLKHPALQECAVIAKENIHGNTHLHAFVVPALSTPPEPHELHRLLEKELPGFMLPASYTYLNNLPKTPSGKINRRALAMLSDNKLKKNPSEEYHPPTNAIETKLVHIWEQLLQTSPIGIKDDFFRIGGYSLLGTNLFYQIEKNLGKKFPVSTLLIAPTIEKLAERIRSDIPPSTVPLLVPLKTGGTKPPLFFMHHTDGGVLDYRELALYLDENQPVFGIQSAFNGSIPTHVSLDEAAEIYSREIQLLCPEGPYLIGGHSFGGKIAFEVARRIRENKKGEIFLLLIDCCAPDCRRLSGKKRLFYLIHSFSAALVFHFVNMVKLPVSQRKLYFIGKIKSLNRRLKQINISIKKLNKPQRDKTLHKKPQKSPVCPMTFPGEIVLFKASISLPVYEKEDYGWSRYTQKEVKVSEIKGEHGNLVKGPYAKAIATELGKYIDDFLTRDTLEKHEQEKGTNGLGAPLPFDKL